MPSFSAPCKPTDRRLLVLGGGVSQLAGIRKAKAMGCRVISLDNRPGNPGHRHADMYVDCDTRDTAGVLRAARRAGINGIVSFRSDTALATWAQVAATLGLPGPLPETVATLADKARFRTFQAANGLLHPPWAAGQSPGEVAGRWGARAGPVVIKPVDCCGSKAVVRLAGVDSSGFAEAIRRAIAASGSRMALVEAAVAGREFGGDAFLRDGRMVFLAISEKRLDGVLVTGHRMPATLVDPGRACIMAALTRTCAEAGYRTGALNFDLMFDGREVTILELSPRNGGNGLSRLIRRVHAFDVETAMIAAALGATFACTVGNRMARGAGVVTFGMARRGPLPRLPTGADLRSVAPQVWAVEPLRAAGEMAEAFAHSGEAVLRVYYDCRDAEEEQSILDRLAGVPIFHTLRPVLRRQLQHGGKEPVGLMADGVEA